MNKPLLLLKLQERRSLHWLQQWAQHQLTALKRRRKYQSPSPFSPEEAALLRALIDLKNAAGNLLAFHDGDNIHERDYTQKDGA